MLEYKRKKAAVSDREAVQAGGVAQVVEHLSKQVQTPNHQNAWHKHK
jgi:hypothetical protein